MGKINLKKLLESGKLIEKYGQIPEDNSFFLNHGQSKIIFDHLGGFEEIKNLKIYFIARAKEFREGEDALSGRICSKVANLLDAIIAHTREQLMIKQDESTSIKFDAKYFRKNKEQTSTAILNFDINGREGKIFARDYKVNSALSLLDAAKNLEKGAYVKQMNHRDKIEMIQAAFTYIGMNYKESAIRI